MQGVVEAVLNRQLGGVSSLSRGPQNTNDGERHVDENNIQNRNSRSRTNLMEPEDESLYDTQCYS